MNEHEDFVGAQTIPCPVCEAKRGKCCVGYEDIRRIHLVRLEAYQALTPLQRLVAKTTVPRSTK